MPPTRATDGPTARLSRSHHLALVFALALLSAPLAGCLGFERPGDAGSSDASEASDPAGDPEGASAPASEAGNGSAGGNATRTPTDEVEPRRSGSPWLGAWLGTWPNGDNREIATFTERTGDRPDVVDVLVSWNTSYTSLEPSLTNVASADARPLITWNPTNLTTTEIANGSTEIQLDSNETVTVDAYIASFADGICAYTDHTGTPPLLEPMPEPNGDWHAWSLGYETEDGDPPNTNESYRRSWTKIHDTFQQRCPDGAEFVWTVNGANRGNGTSYMGAFPGSDATDLAGLRGINLGGFQDRGWASFAATYGPAYCNVTQETDLDVVLTAVGSVERGGDKGAWIEEAYQNASSHAWARVEGIVWYDDELSLPDGTVDVSLDSSPEALDAYRSSADRVRSDTIPDGEPPPC